MSRVLIATAVEPEREAVARGLGLPHVPDPLSFKDEIVVVPVGVGLVQATSRTQRLLTQAQAAQAPFGLVISAGIAGGFAGRAAVGDTVLASRSVAADLGAQTGDGFLSLQHLGFGYSTMDTDSAVLSRMREALPDAIVGEVLTVATVTGTGARATQLATTYPDAVAEAMEGFGVATAAAEWEGIDFAELRTISNPIGPRDRGAWHIREALSALAEAAGALLPVLLRP
jgi:futalosine hydrolase